MNKYFVRTMLQRMLQGTLELLLFFPLFVAVAAYCIPSHQIVLFLLMLPLLYPLAFALQTALHMKARYQLLSASLFIACAAAGAFMSDWKAMSFVTASSFLIVYRAFLLDFAGWRRLLHEGWIMTALILQFLFQFLFRYAPALKPYSTFSAWAGFAAFAAAVLLINRWHLQNADHSEDRGRRIPAEITRRNYILTLFFIGIVLLVTHIIDLWKAVKMLFRSILLFLLYLSSLFQGKKVGDQPAVPAKPMQLGGPGHTSGHSWLETLIEIAGGILAASIAVLLLYFLGKVLLRLVRAGAAYLSKRFSGQTGEGYVDEKSSTLEGKDWGHPFVSALHRWRTRFKREMNLHEAKDNSEKIRILFRNEIRSGMNQGWRFRSSYTAKEALQALFQFRDKHPSSVLEELYNRARYSDKPISDEEVEAARKQAERDN